MHFWFIINSFARIAIALSIFMATPILWAIHFHEDAMVWIFGELSLFTLLSGLIILLLSHKKRQPPSQKDRYFIVSMAWFFLGLLGAMPFYFSGYVPSMTDAMFESVSGFSTTGASILTDVEVLPYSLLFWRSLTHWIGGMGIILLVIAVFPMFRTTGYQMFNMEASTLLNQKLKPHFADIARRLWAIYIGITIVLVALLMLGGLNFFDSLCHAFGTVATGGFSTKNASIGAFSPHIQYVIALFMIISGMNFTLHYFLLKGDFKKLTSNSELKLYLSIIIVFTLVIASILYFEKYPEIEKAFRIALFQVASILTATGFATDDYLMWPTQGWIFIFALLFIGGCVGSTSGGPKVIRYVFTLKYSLKKFLALLHPKAIINIKINGRNVTQTQVSSVLSFIMFYFLVFAFGTFCMSLLGVDLATAMGSVITAQGGVGPGIGTVGPASNFAHLPDLGKILLTILMIAGRLELYTFLILFTPHFWKSNIN
ncbi:MAG TPA: TrkH family potassium uptake protein [Salinivirgaceae bacterium]|nr:TrkH family potassium uptake protein [Salinivirgaceae bacterium]